MKSKPRTRERQLKHKHRAGWLYSIPGFIFLILFFWYPLILSFVVAFQHWHPIRPPVYVGLNNFQLVFNHPLTPLVFKNTLIYAGLRIALTFLIPIIVAILIMEMRKSTIRTMMILWFIPTAGVALTILWKYIYNPFYGLLNAIFVGLGFAPQRWLSDKNLTMLCLILPSLIMFAPGLIYIGALQTIPEELYEAAELEGAGFWSKIWHITLPRIRPVIAMLLILAVISAFQEFNLPYIMTKGGPGNATLFAVQYLWRTAFGYMKFGEGTAIAILLFFFLLALTIIQRKFFRENVDE